MAWKCSRCETLNRDTLQSCEVCGRARPAGAAIPEAPAAPRRERSPLPLSEPAFDRAPGASICRCGRAFRGPREWVCPACGQPQFGYVACPGCGRKTYAGAPYCRRCGRTLTRPGARL